MEAARRDERISRSNEAILVKDIPNFPGILAAMMISPELAAPLRSLADFLLVTSYPQATISRLEREILATAVSAGNDCFYCMDSHAAFAEALLAQEGRDTGNSRDLTNRVKLGDFSALPSKIQCLARIACLVREGGRQLTPEAVAAARDTGASDADIQLAVLISAAFCMYNRVVDGFRAYTPSDPSVFDERAQQIAAYGYSDHRITAVTDEAELPSLKKK